MCSSVLLGFKLRISPTPSHLHGASESFSFTCGLQVNKLTTMKRTANKQKADYRSHCPVNFGLESLGDRWSLLIVRDIVFFGKKTYGELLKAEERIATNILDVRSSSAVSTRAPSGENTAS